MNDQQDLWKLLARCAFNEATRDEVAQLQHHFKKDPALQQRYDWLVQIMQKEEDAALKEDSTAEAVNRILNKAAQNELFQKNGRRLKNRQRLKFRRRLAIAASFIAIAGFTCFAFWGKGKKNTGTTIEAVVAETTKAKTATLLPDGTKVWLNTGSKLIVEPQFGSNTREVKLTGEAFFDVVKDTARPFVVHVNKMNIRVLGTAFNVKGYDDDKAIQTTLYRGLVHITKQGDTDFQPIIMYPNQKITVPKALLSQGHKPLEEDVNNAIVLLQIDSTINDEQKLETSWMYGRLEFKGERFEQVAAKMARWYGVKFLFENDGVKQLSFTGSFEKETLTEALDAMQVAQPFIYKKNNNEIIISSAY